MSQTPLFVYGTLCPGQPNEHWLTRIGGRFEKASVRGKLIPQGWGAALGYPGLIPDTDGDEVAGYLFFSEALENHWQALDEFEGEGYERVLILAETADGNQLEAQIYGLKPI